jgi:diguanylate cyclase (GGDEF)-like protein
VTRKPDFTPNDSSAPRVVVAEDDRSSRRILTRVLSKWGYEVFEAENGEEGWSRLTESGAPVLITDWQMPGMTGLELVERLRSGFLPYYVYTILLTSKGDTEEVVQGFQSGVDDYLTKPFKWEELRARLRAGQRIVTLESALREARVRLEIMASTDELTGVANRRAVLRRLAEMTAMSSRSKHDVSVAMIDIDKFKRLNDTFGHAAGDYVLRETVRRLAVAKREYDIIGRIGGEEFVVLLPETGLEDAKAVAERLRAGVADNEFLVNGKQPVNVTISCGVSSAANGQCDSVDSLLALADAALYRAKAAGRNRVESGGALPVTGSDEDQSAA